MSDSLIGKCTVTRGDTTLMYGLSTGRHTMRVHLKLDQRIDPQKLRVAVDKTADRYPYFCVSLKKNDAEYYYEQNGAPVALIHSREQITLNSPETNGHIWAVCYDEDSLFVNIYHGRTDGTGAYALVATLLYYYLSQQYEIGDCSGIRTAGTPVSEREVRDPLDDLPLIDIRAVKRPPAPVALSLMEASRAQRSGEKGVILKLSVPEKTFIPFCKENNASPGIMMCALMGRAIRRVHPKLPEAVMGSYVVNARPMLRAEESSHNCINRIMLEFDEQMQNMPLNEQCATLRARTNAQADEDRIRQAMIFSASLAQTILNLPTLELKVQAARKAILAVLRACTYTVSYVGRWKFPQLGEHIREFWLETPAGAFPLLELSAVNGQIFVAMIQTFEDRVYYDALLEELKEQAIPYVEHMATPVLTPDIIM